ncbi:phytanoyl-CoA dioxygenase family protein [Schlesneria paludicola]|uniref:phytanoyl-CoA dioxygenase family protein n=1 Tax=Schlesneria paludicola TaxID=360056 RepID=UPI00029A9973|nr:phytanoyl-CoA dioxygenase family protein [Schlesneria paludicola]
MSLIVEPAADPKPKPLFTLGKPLDLSPACFGFLRETYLDVPVEQLREQMEHDGYLYLREFWDRAQVQAVRDSITRQLHDLGFLRPGTPTDEARFSDREVGRAMGNPLNQHDPVLRELVFGERITDFFHNFLGGPVAHFDFIWFRTKGPGLGSPIHCDLVYMGRGTHDLYTTWVPLGDVELDLGGLLVLEGSHHHSERLNPYLSRDVDNYCSNRPDADEYASGRKWWDGTLTRNAVWLQKSLGGRWLTSPEFQMGDAVIFNMKLIHGSLDNQTDRIRLSTDTRYQLASQPIDERWIGQTPPGHATSQRRGRIC